MDSRVAKTGPVTLIVILAILVSPALADDIQPITNWTIGTSGPSRFTAGTDRFLIFTAGAEENGSTQVTSVTYGGQAMTEVTTDVAGSSTTARAHIFYLNEAGIQAATSNTFSVNWSQNPNNSSYAARMYENVDQSSPIRDSDKSSTSSSSPNPISTPALTVVDGDYAVACAQCGNTGSNYTWYNGFSEGTDFTASSSRHSTADRAISSDGTATPSAQHSGPNRQVILGAVLKSTNVAAPPVTYYVRTDGSDSNSGTGASASEAWATMSHAAANASTPGDVIYVRAGTYAESVQPLVSGNSSNPTMFVADTSGAVFGVAGDVIIQASSGNDALNLSSRNHLHFSGFTFQGDNNSQDCVDIDSCDGIAFERCILFEAGDKGLEISGSSTSVTMTNCLIYNCDDDAVHLYSGELTIWNSTIADNGSDGIAQDSGTLTVRNCIIVFSGFDGLDYNGGSISHAYNLIYGNDDRDWEGTSSATGELSQDPLFVGSGDYHLSAGSPAINDGTNAGGTVDDDKDGNPRPVGGSWDIGCYEANLAHWNLDETNGTTAADSSGIGNDAVLSGGITFDADSTVACTTGSNSLLFDGINDELIATGYKAISGANARTISAWFQTEQTGAIIHWGDTTAGGEWTVRVQDDHGAEGAIGVDVGSGYVVGTTDLRDGAWHHVAVVLPSGANDVTGVLIYVDGALESTSASSPQAIDTGSTDDVLVGNDASNRYFNGTIDDVRVYNFELSASTVGQLSGFIGHWAFEEASGTTAADSSTQANDGTLANGASWVAGKIGDGAIDLDGSNDRVDLPDMNFDFSGGLAISLWINPSSTPGSYVAFLGISNGSNV
ncbi:MAG: right-handed parallel beta-helix repeat-containing protein, partial [Planctomycetales bacterium]|nr:right-handed parallel beta-helix repeat-containing protein [Planctomycetales bacterium]